jgi:hypothetical protein
VPSTNAPGPSSGGASPDFVPGYILVQPRPGLPRAAFEKVLGGHGGRVIGKQDDLDVYVV